MYPLATKAGSNFNIWKIAGAVVAVAVVLVCLYFWLKPPDTPFTRAVALIRAGKAAAAIPVLEKLAREHPDNSAIFPWLAQGYLKTERLGEGRTALDTALRFKLPSAELLPVVLSYAAYYESKGDFEEAEKLFQSAERACPPEKLAAGRAEMYLKWADYEKRQERLPEAIVRLEQGQALIPQVEEPLAGKITDRLSDYYRQLAALAEVKEKDDRKAIGLLEKSLSVADEPATRMALANIYSRQGRFDKAIESYDTVSRSDPNNLEARHRLVDLLVQRKEYRRAQEALMELTDRERSVENYQLLSALNLKLGNYAGAVKALEDATNLRPKDPVLYGALYRVLVDWSGILAREGKGQESISVKGHAERVAEVLAMMGSKAGADKDDDERAEQVAAETLAAVKAEPPPWNPKIPPVQVVSARTWLARGSLTPEGEITIKNITGRPVTDLTLTVVFYDNTSRARNGSVSLPVASPASKPFAAGEVRSLYFSCPNIVKADHQLAVIIFWKGRLLKEFPVTKVR